MLHANALVLYCGLILLVSLLGGIVPSVMRLTHRRVQLSLCLVSGVMIGVGLLHMLGHAVEMTFHGSVGSIDVHDVMLAAMLGFLAMFLLERFFCFHHHETPDESGHTCGHEHGSDQRSCPDDAPASTHRLQWVGALVGLTVHTLLAGIALGAAVSAAGPDGWPAFGVFLGIVLHKPFDSFTIIALMRHGGNSPIARHLVNLGFALVIPIGVGLFLVGSEIFGEGEGFTSLALAFSAGVFICIAASDLLPELQFHRHDRLSMTAMLILGLVIAWVSGIAESSGHHHGHHGHGHHGHGHEAGNHGHDHHGHEGHEGHEGHDHGPGNHGFPGVGLVGPSPRGGEGG